ncbi:hypothetical protein OG884_20145 [Streptosporangium sp. NBC_01755]|uniref:hypothetical protein n=1 Tax=unclassified Streptosporangium TaxID=2632669 RepID=UPI002DD7A78A|nr:MULTISPECIES: hypothetical protein [unclassified Streptosporangium]WSA24708.1 hypothetical protein OIE13_27765 [Streptosporangium sp. NBC_01810]WSC97215.1 hypothetical protein OG884_20145 [Streptosporangium sp. NBC_01755]
MSAPDGQADAHEQAPAAPGIKYGVRWTPGPGQHPTVIPSISPDEAESLAHRVGVLQQVSGNVDDAVAVYRVPGEEWTVLLPPHASRLIIGSAVGSPRRGRRRRPR